jgi:two-component system cell cycle sensor histidine kinase/response regulator CckA
VNVSTSAMRDSEGRLIGFVRVLRDITERVRGEEELRRHENQLRQAQKMEAVGQLAGGVAHDFNNMLTAIRGYTDLLRDDLATTPEAEQGFDEIGKAVDRAAALTGQLLAFSRKQMMQPRALNPADTVRDMESMLRRLLVGSVDMVTELDPDVGQITVDPAQLQQVVLNLVINARDAMPNGGRLTIRTENVELTEAMCAEHQGMTRGAHVAMSVTDDGVGMSADILTHIFEPFFTTKKLGTGTGLGLSTAYGIVKQSGGYILVDSRPGLGSKFTVYFPRTWESCPIPAPHRAPVAQPPGTATILLVDDEDSVRRMLTQLLERHGYTVLAAQDGVDALAVSDRYTGRIDLLITDIMMPRMHGRDLSKRLQERRPDTRVLFMSGYASDEIVERGLLDARMAFIQKPFEISELMAKARDTLRRSSVG